MATIHHFIQDIVADNGWVATEHTHHIRTVLRLTIGDFILFSDGKGTQWETQIDTLDPLRVSILSTTQKPSKPPYLTLILSAIRPKNIELVLEKVTEIGVDRIILTKTDYSQIPLDILNKKSQRFTDIITAAMKQSERATMPEFHICPDSELSQYHGELNLIGTTQYTEQPPSLSSILTKSTPSPSFITLFIGPEGGFSQAEYLDIQSSFIPVTFSPNTLRTETAAILGSGIIIQEKI